MNKCEYIKYMDCSALSACFPKIELWHESCLDPKSNDKLRKILEAYNEFKNIYDKDEEDFKIFKREIEVLPIHFCPDIEIVRITIKKCFYGNSKNSGAYCDPNKLTLDEPFNIYFNLERFPDENFPASFIGLFFHEYFELLHFLALRKYYNIDDIKRIGHYYSERIEYLAKCWFISLIELDEIRRK